MLSHPLLGAGQWSGAQEWATIPKSVGYVEPVEDPKMFFPPILNYILNLCLENNNKNFRKGKKELLKQNQGQNGHQLC